MKPLPPAWYSTIPAVAAQYGRHPDDITYFLDSGAVKPGVLVPKWQLPHIDALGPAPHLVVMLPDFRQMAWTHTAAGSCAPLAGEFTAFEVDGFKFKNLVLDAPGVYAWRHNLVLTRDQQEVLADLGAPVPRLSNQERKTLHLLLQFFLRQSDYASRVDKPYGVGDDVSSELLTMYGITLSGETIAQKLKASATTFDAVKQCDETQGWEAA